MTAVLVPIVVALIGAGPLWVATVLSNRKTRRENTEQHETGQNLIAGLTTAATQTATAVGEVKGLLQAHIDNPNAHTTQEKVS